MQSIRVIMGMSFILPKKLAIRAIGIYSGADLAKLAEPFFNVLIYAFERLRCALRRHHSL